MNKSQREDEICFDLPRAYHVPIRLRGIPESVVFVDPTDIVIQTIRSLISVKVDGIPKLEIQSPVLNDLLQILNTL